MMTNPQQIAQQQMMMQTGEYGEVQISEDLCQDPRNFRNLQMLPIANVLSEVPEGTDPKIRGSEP